jgi:site-specific DNA-cytosine methylase
MQRLWLSVISRCGYRYRQFLLSPDSLLGIPNTRKRYYCIAVFDENHTSSNIQQTIVGISQSIELPSFPRVEEDQEQEEEQGEEDGEGKRKIKRKNGEENKNQSQKKNDNGDDNNKDNTDRYEEDYDEEDNEESEEQPGEKDDKLDDGNDNNHSLLQKQNENSSTDPITTVFTSLPHHLPPLSSETIITEPKTIEETLLRRISPQEWQQYNHIVERNFFIFKNKTRRKFIRVHFKIPSRFVYP